MLLYLQEIYTYILRTNPKNSGLFNVEKPFEQFALDLV